MPDLAVSTSFFLADWEVDNNLRFINIFLMPPEYTNHVLDAQPRTMELKASTMPLS